MELGGIHLESMEYLWNIPCEFHVEFPYGFHGFQVDSTYSMWNMHRTKTPIWVGFHPKHIPYGMGGIHVECGGRVKTSDFCYLLSKIRKFIYYIRLDYCYLI